EGAIVLEPVAGLLRRSGCSDDALLPRRCDAQAVARRQRSRRAKHDTAELLLHDRGVFAARALWAGIERGLLERHIGRQRDARLGLIDREGPAGAGRVPVELVVVGEESDLARGAIFDDVFMRAEAQRAVGAADANAHAIRHALGGPGLRRSVAG